MLSSFELNNEWSCTPPPTYRPNWTVTSQNAGGFGRPGGTDKSASRYPLLSVNCDRRRPVRWVNENVGAAATKNPRRPSCRDGNVGRHNWRTEYSVSGGSVVARQSPVSKLKRTKFISELVRCAALQSTRHWWTSSETSAGSQPLTRAKLQFHRHPFRTSPRATDLQMINIT